MDLVPEDAELEFTASAFVVDSGTVLFIDHEKTGYMLQPGGHIETNEVPHEAAVREVREETGVEVELHGHHRRQRYSDVVADVPQPYKLNTHRIREGHWHCDHVFFATPENVDPVHSSTEHGGKIWMTGEEIRGHERVPENVRDTALDALELIG
ncbi:MAG: NUDIX domain-containing protein [Halobacteria archaeon]